MNSLLLLKDLHLPFPLIPTTSESQPGERKFNVSCDCALGGPWAGVNDLFSSLMDEILGHSPELATHHALELTYVLPALRRIVRTPEKSFTQAGVLEERVRHYANDRAFRLVHGLIDLLDSWKTAACPSVPWCIVCENYDRAGAIGQYFFRELMRRRGHLLNIRLILLVGTELQDGECAHMSSAEAAAAAADLEQHISADPAAAEGHAPYLIHLWTLANRDDKVLHWKCFVTDLYLRRGLYEDALRHATGLLELADKCTPEDQNRRLWIVSKTLNGFMGIQDHQRSVAFVEEVVLPILKSPPSRQHIDLIFSVAMIYARYKKPRDLVKGEEFLDRGLAMLDRIDISPVEYHYSYVFNRNGVAMIRSFQSRFEEAIGLCHDCIQRLNQHLGTDDHRLQRSVLIHNIAQVCFAMGRHTEAVEHYTAVIQLNPDDSEYYNERGNILLLLGRYEEARADYMKAIQLSPPYHEFHTNLGQCYRRMGEFSKAIACYTRALDLRADQTLALVGRGDAHQEVGQSDQAIADYTAALELDSSQWEVLANRGVVLYGEHSIPGRRAAEGFAAASLTSGYEPRSTASNDLPIATRAGRYQPDYLAARAGFQRHQHRPTP